MRSGLAAAAAVAAVILAACQGNPAHRQPVGPDDGLQLTGRIGDRQFHVTDGEPEVDLASCDVAGRLALCIESFTINGDPVTLIVGHPDSLDAGEAVNVVRSCPSIDCDGNTEVTIVRQEGRTVANEGELVVSAAGPRYAATFRLRMVGGGVVTGRFNVLPSLRPPATP